MELKDLQATSQLFTRMQEDGFLFAKLNELSEEKVQAVSKTYEPVDRIQPVNLLRYLVSRLLLEKKKIDAAVIEELKQAIESRNVSSYVRLSAELQAQLLSYKKSGKGMFPQWSKHFRVLYPFFWSVQDNKAAEDCLKRLGQEIIDKYQIKSARVHAVGFSGPQNYGDTSVWGAIIPEDINNVQLAYQLFYRITSDGLQASIMKGHKVKGDEFEVSNVLYKTWEEVLGEYSGLIPEWQELNADLAGEFDKDEIAFKDRLSRLDKEDVAAFFTIFDKAATAWDLENNEKLIFSIASEQVSFHVGKRYCLVLKGDLFNFIAPEDYKVEGKQSVPFRGEEGASYQEHYDRMEVLTQSKVIIDAIGKEIERGKHPGGSYKFDNLSFRKAAFDLAYRKELLGAQVSLSVDNYITMDRVSTSLNTILYGPPGTGKTYTTIEQAVQFASNRAVNLKKRMEVREEYERLVNEGRIVFTTVHQSMSYEDFIEGIKPVMNDVNKDGIGYQIQSGIFKVACANAAYLCYQTYLKAQKTSTNYGFDELYDAFIEDLQNKLEMKMQPVFKSIQGRDVGVKGINKNDSIIARAANSVAKASAPLTKENLQKLYDRFKTIEEIQDLGQVKEAVEVTPRITEFYAVFNGLKQFEKTYTGNFNDGSGDVFSIVLNQEEVIRKFDNGVFDEAVLKYHAMAPKSILILDEINRGNVSQLFGELITLLEYDKRWGNNEGLRVRLPYSKTNFFVPANLYVIGTMNTADRSVEALDTALRRRFTFFEMTPNYELAELNRQVYGVNVRDLLRTINKRIELLRDSDHVIGHSYFMGEDLNLKELFKNKIIPLLQEYFFGDYGKIGLVLGSGFVKIEKKGNAEEVFSAFDYEDKHELAEKVVYRLQKFDGSQGDEDFRQALKTLMKL